METVNTDAQEWKNTLPMHDDLLLDLSMMARLLGLLSRERFASEMSAVTRVIVILQGIKK
jgi:hypothetical protein